MSCLEDHVERDWSRVVILLTLQMKALESLHYTTKSG